MDTKQNIKENNWPSFSKALKSIHIPNTMIEVDNRSLYLQRLSFDEVFANQLGMQIYKKKYQILNVNKNKRKSKYFNKCLEKFKVLILLIHKMNALKIYIQIFVQKLK